MPPPYLTEDVTKIIIQLENKMIRAHTKSDCADDDNLLAAESFSVSAQGKLQGAREDRSRRDWEVWHIVEEMKEAQVLRLADGAALISY